MKNINWLGCLLAIILLTSCDIDEKGVPKPVVVPSDAITTTVSMGATYQYQIYYDLETNKQISKNLKTDWDLAFEATSSGFHVILNTSKTMFAYNAATNNFDVADTAGKMTNLLVDAPSGSMDSTAIGDWRNTKNVFFIDRGFDATGSPVGYKKVQFTSVDENGYTLKIADLNGSNAVEKTITKDSSYNFMFLSLSSADVVSVEPPKDTWDLTFSQYITIFYEPAFTPYLVTGCLANRFNTESAKDSVISFKDINESTVAGLTFTSAINGIGYDWKTFGGTTYTTNPGMIYIIRNRRGNIYKLHFLNFYSATGEKGNPLFEFQKL